MLHMVLRPMNKFKQMRFMRHALLCIRLEHSEVVFTAQDLHSFGVQKRKRNSFTDFYTMLFDSTGRHVNSPLNNFEC